MLIRNSLLVIVYIPASGYGASKSDETDLEKSAEAYCAGKCEVIFTELVSNLFEKQVA